MKIYKEIDINLDSHRANLKIPEFNYSKEEIEKLSLLYDLLEKGSWHVAIEFARQWSNEEQELIPCEIYNILFDIGMGGTYKFES